MRVRCEHTTLDAIRENPEMLAWWRRAVHLTELPLVIGKTYLVYAYLVDPLSTWYYIVEEEGLDYPVAHPAPFFTIVDPRPSALWVERETPQRRLVAIPEWADDPMFYERLVDGGQAQVRAFSAARARMDLEFDRPDVTRAAILLDERWVMCPVCDEAWATDSLAALLRCNNPHCDTLLRNPLARGT